MEVFNFRDQLRNALDDAVSAVLYHENYDHGLDWVSPSCEEVIAEEIARIITGTLVGITNDLSKLERQILADLEELRDRKKRRDESVSKQIDTFGKIVDRAYKYLEERGSDNAGQKH